MAGKRKYNTRRIKATWPYSVTEIADLFSLHKNAVSRWLKEGLQVDTTRRPYLIRGDALIRFLDARQQRKTRPCTLAEFFCFKCRAPREAYGGIADLTIESPTRLRVKALCVACDTPVNKVQSMKNRPKIEASFHVQKREGWHLIESINPSVNSDKRQAP